MSLYGALAEDKREGKRVLVAKGALVAGVLVVTTDFANIDAVAATIESATAPVTSLLTYSVAGNKVTVRGWKPTSVGSTTLIATTGTEPVSVTITGRRRA